MSLHAGQENKKNSNMLVYCVRGFSKVTATSCVWLSVLQIQHTCGGALVGTLRPWEWGISYGTYNSLTIYLFNADIWAKHVERVCGSHLCSINRTVL